MTYQGIALFNQARFTEALQAFRGNPPFEALCLEMLGDYDTAYKWYLSLPLTPHTAQGIARCSRYFGEPETGIYALENIPAWRADDNEADPRWELLPLYHMAGRYKEAWDLAHELNGDPVPVAEWELLTHRHWDTRSTRTESPVFVTGMPRSGTTLMAKMLSKCGLKNLGEYDRMVRLPGMIHGYPLELGNLEVAGDFYLEDISERTVDKTPLNIFRAGLIKSIFPNAIIIRMVRDWRDVALSCFFRNFHAYEWSRNLLSIKDCIEGERIIADFWKDYFDIVEVSYEDLVFDPEGVMREVCCYSGVTFDESCLSFHEDKSWTEGSTLEVRKPIDPQIGKWRHYESFDYDYWHKDVPTEAPGMDSRALCSE